MNFDWYGASVDVDPGEALGEASRWLDQCESVPMRGRHGFAAGMSFTNGRGRVLDVLWANRATHVDSVFFESSGKWAYPLSSFLRQWKPVHRVARVDVAEDYVGAGSWDRLSGLCLDVADEHGIEVEHAGDHHRAIKGRSIYLGGRTSVVREICYEKGKQIGGDPNHVRLELRVRPGSREAKYRAAELLPAELYGASNWSQDLAVRLGNPEVARMSLGTVYRAEDVERSRKALLRQYGNTLQGIASEVGSWSAAGEWLGAELAKS